MNSALFLFVALLIVLFVGGGLVMLIVGLSKNKTPLWIAGSMSIVLSIITGIWLFVSGIMNFAKEVVEDVKVEIEKKRIEKAENHEEDRSSVPEEIGEAFGDAVTGVIKELNDEFTTVKIYPEKSLEEKGITIGAVTRSEDNKLSVYFIFKNDYSGKLVIKTFDNDKKESGRSVNEVTGKKDEAHYIDFEFDKRTDFLKVRYCTLE